MQRSASYTRCLQAISAAPRTTEGRDVTFDVWRSECGTEQITFGSLFAGIGGLDLGLERAGMRCEWQVEIDDYATKVLEKHWPDVLRVRDVRNAGRHNLPEVDLICGGFPCQPVSVAGRRKGRDDERWLWPEFARVVGELRPRWVLAENVPGLLSADSGRLFGGVLRDLAALGYDAEWDCIPAAALGAPHRRDRVFVFAYDRGERIHGLFEGEICRKPAFSWSKDVRGIEDLRERPDIHTPLLCGAGDGVPNRVDRLRALGNAVVPQVAEWIGRRIQEALMQPRKEGE